MEIKLPEGFDSRDAAIRAIIEDEISRAEEELPEIRTVMARYLLEHKGYRQDDLERDASFSFTLAEETHTSVADILIRLGGKRIVLLKCFSGALISRERHALAMARLIDEYQIPITIVTDAGTAVILDTLTGKTIAEGIAAIPSRQELESKVSELSFQPLPEEKREKVQRILMAFDAVKCASITEEE